MLLVDGCHPRSLVLFPSIPNCSLVFPNCSPIVPLLFPIVPLLFPSVPNCSSVVPLSFIFHCLLPTLPTSFSPQGSDFHKDMDAAANRLTPQHNYRLTAEEMAGRHFGELSCREFRDSVLKSLPHSWTRRSDTRIVARQFVRNTVANKKTVAGDKAEPTNAVARAVAHVVRAAGRGGGNDRRLQATQAHRYCVVCCRAVSVCMLLDMCDDRGFVVHALSVCMCTVTVVPATPW